MDIAEKTLRLKQDFDDVFEAGKNAGQSDFWDAIQFNGTRNNYAYAFARWDVEYVRPKYKVIPTDANGVGNIFVNCSNLKKIEAEYFDFSQKLTGTNNNAGYYYAFSNCSVLEEIEDVGLIPQHNYYYAFSHCYNLHTIAKMGVDANTKYQNTFQRCNNLVNLTLDGTIGQNDFDIHWSTKLSADSLKSIINALADKSGTGTTFTITLGTENLAKLTDAEKAIATQKGWSFG